MKTDDDGPPGAWLGIVILVGILMTIAVIGWWEITR